MENRLTVRAGESAGTAALYLRLPQWLLTAISEEAGRQRRSKNGQIVFELENIYKPRIAEGEPESLGVR